MSASPAPLQISELEKKTIEAVVNVFETGKPTGDYGAVTCLSGDTGHLTYGRSQTTLASGNLYLLLRNYVDAANAQYSVQITPYLTGLLARDTSLDTDYAFRELLKECGQDPVMKAVQDSFFDTAFWIPTSVSAARLDLKLPLSFAVAYDSHIQGGWATIAQQTIEKVGTIGTAGVQEQDWILSYINIRKAWLTAKSTLLARTTYRMDAFSDLIAETKWRLDLPITVVGRIIDQTSLDEDGSIRASAEDPTQRLLYLASPFLSGPDVVSIQQALQRKGFACYPDGIYGNYTAALVRAFQQRSGLAADGVVGPATRNLLLDG